jgi:hypothetical protein
MTSRQDTWRSQIAVERADALISVRSAGISAAETLLALMVGSVASKPADVAEFRNCRLSISLSGYNWESV